MVFNIIVGSERFHEFWIKPILELHICIVLKSFDKQKLSMGKIDEKKETNVGKYFVLKIILCSVHSFYKSTLWCILFVDNSNDEIQRKFVEKHFLDELDKDKKLSAGIAAIKTLLMVLEKTNCKSKK